MDGRLPPVAIATGSRKQLQMWLFGKRVRQ
jgi:hypothetical protein